jgi:hypothetical protein
VNPEGPISPFALHFQELGQDQDGEDFGSYFIEPLLHQRSKLNKDVIHARPEAMSLVHFKAAFIAVMANGQSVSICIQNGLEVSRRPPRGRAGRIQ